MRRFFASGLAALSLCAFATCTASAAASTSAPADEYFGRYHLSILGIRNAIFDMTTRAHGDSSKAAAFLNSAELTEDAIHQWQARYPQDAWLPKTIFSLERLYISLGTQEAAERAVATSAWLDKSFPQTGFAALGHNELANLSTSDDGSVATADSPAVLGMVPALADSPASVATDASPSQQSPLPSYAYAIPKANNATPLSGPHAENTRVAP